MKSQTLNIQDFIEDELPVVRSTEREVLGFLLQKVNAAVEAVRDTNLSFNAQINAPLAKCKQWEKEAILRCLN